MEHTVRRLPGTASGTRSDSGNVREGVAYLGLSVGVILGYILTIGPIFMGLVSLCSLADSSSIFESWMLSMLWCLFAGNIILLTIAQICVMQRNWIGALITVAKFSRWRGFLLITQMLALIGYYPWASFEIGMRAFFVALSVAGGIVTMLILISIERETHRLRTYGATVLAEASKP